MPQLPPGAGVEPAEGVRERKRRETRQLIANVALRLFLANGYDNTTLDAIAAEAGISRRTFFSYFKSKDDIILFGLEADLATLVADLLKTSPDVAPFDAVRDVMVKRIARYTSEEMLAIDTLMLSSESLIARKQVHYAEQERALFNALCEVWRQPERRPALQIVAMVAVGAMRVALSTWREQTGQRTPVATILRDTFERLRTEL